jgi:hypothetical protein
MSDFNVLMSEFGRRVRGQEVPREVVEAATLLAHRTEELAYFVPECDAAPRPGTSKLAAGLHPSDLLLEIMEAMRASEFEKALVIIRRGLGHTLSSAAA